MGTLRQLGIRDRITNSSRRDRGAARVHRDFFLRRDRGLASPSFQRKCPSSVSRWNCQLVPDLRHRLARSPSRWHAENRHERPPGDDQGGLFQLRLHQARRSLFVTAIVIDSESATAKLRAFQTMNDIIGDLLAHVDEGMLRKNGNLTERAIGHIALAINHPCNISRADALGFPQSHYQRHHSF